MLLLCPKSEGSEGSISPSNFDGQLPNILLTCLCLWIGIRRVVYMPKFQSLRSGVHYFLVWCTCKFYGLISKHMGGYQIVYENAKGWQI